MTASTDHEAIPGPVSPVLPFDLWPRNSPVIGNDNAIAAFLGVGGRALLLVLLRRRRRLNGRRHRAHHPPRIKGAKSGAVLAIQIISGVQRPCCNRRRRNVTVEVPTMAQSSDHRPRRDPVHLRRSERVLQRQIGVLVIIC